MATKMKLGVLFCLFHCCFSFGIFDDLLGDTDKCEDICSNTYPLHTYEKSVHLGYCRRGCRLFTIIDFVNDDENLNNTKDSCSYSCQEAHQDKEDLDACTLGCDSQVNIVAKKKQKFSRLDNLQPPQDLLSPFMYVHNLYSNMIDKFNRHTSISWSFYMQNNNGNLVVVKSGPHINADKISTMLTDDDDDMFEDDYKTSNYIETNIASLDNSITPNVKHSQVHGLEADLDGINYAANTHAREEQPQDWLGCIAKKTGLPRLLLSLTIFVSAIVMIWLCFTTAATAPEQKVPSQKLSIYGDLDYLSQLNDKALLANVHPQDTMEAAPLPIKIRVERI